MSDELVVVAVDDPAEVLLVQLDRPDEVSGVFVPGTGGATPADITAAIEAHRSDPEAHYQYLRWEDGDNRYVQQPVLDDYATKMYVDEQVGSGGAGKLGHTEQVPTPVTLVQVTHNMLTPPAGVLCIDTLGQISEPDTITQPASGITEVSFGVPFSGTIYLS